MGDTKRGASRRRRGRGVLALAVLGALVGSALLTAPAAATLPTTATVLPGVMGAMVVDAATSHVFVSLPAAGKVAVLDFDGKLVATITGEAGARGLALDANHLYVVRSGTGAIDEIDTGSLTKTR